MRKLKSMLVALAIVAGLGLFFQPTQVRADEGGGGPQNTSNSQSSGGSSPTMADVIRTLVIILHF